MEGFFFWSCLVVGVGLRKDSCLVMVKRQPGHWKETESLVMAALGTSTSLMEVSLLRLLS